MIVNTFQIKPLHWGTYESEDYQQGSILCPHQLNAQIQLEDSTFQDRGVLWFSPALFQELNSGFNPVGATPQQGYYIEFPGAAPGTTYSMPVKSKSGQSKLVNPNYRCEVTIDSANQATINLYFNFLADRNAYFNDTLYTPRELALRSIVFDNSELRNQIPSAYNTTAELGGYFFYQAPGDVSPEFYNEEITLQARFYNEGIRINRETPVASEMSLQVEVLNEQGEAVTEVNPYEDYTVQLTLDAPIAPTAALINLFPDINDYDNVDTVEKELPIYNVILPNEPGSTKIRGPVYGPSSEFTGGLGNTSYGFFTIKGAELLQDVDYFLALVVGNDSYSNTFLLQPFRTTKRPSTYRPEGTMGMDLTIKDYNDNTGNDVIRSAVVDRNKAVLSISKQEYSEFTSDFDYSNGLASEELRAVKFQIFDNDTSELLEEATGQWDGSALITTDPDLSLADNSDSIVFEYQFRNLFQNLANFKNYGAKDLLIVGYLEFGYSETQDTVAYGLEARMLVREFDNEQQDALITSIIFRDPDTNTEVTDLQNYEKRYLKVESIIDPTNAGLDGNPYEFFHHAFTDRFPFGVNAKNDQQLKGQQAYDGALSRESNAIISQQSVQYDPDTKIASFLMDLNAIDTSEAQNVYVVAKGFIDVCFSSFIVPTWDTILEFRIREEPENPETFIQNLFFTGETNDDSQPLNYIRNEAKINNNTGIATVSNMGKNAPDQHYFNIERAEASLQIGGDWHPACKVVQVIEDSTGTFTRAATVQMPKEVATQDLASAASLREIGWSFSPTQFPDNQLIDPVRSNQVQFENNFPCRLRYRIFRNAQIDVDAGDFIIGVTGELVYEAYNEYISEGEKNNPNSYQFTGRFDGDDWFVNNDLHPVPDCEKWTFVLDMEDETGAISRAVFDWAYPET